MPIRFTRDEQFHNTYGINPVLLDTPGLYWRFVNEGTVVPLSQDTAFLAAGKEGEMEILTKEEYLVHCKEVQAKQLVQEVTNTDLAESRLEAAQHGLKIPKNASAQVLKVAVGRKKAKEAVEAKEALEDLAAA